MSQARLPRTEPSTELITAHKVNHRAAHVAGRALGIFAKVRSHRVTAVCVRCARLGLPGVDNDICSHSCTAHKAENTRETSLTITKFNSRTV